MTLIQDLSRESTGEELVQESEDVKPDTKIKAHTPILGFMFFGIVGLLCFNFFLQSLQYFQLSFSGDFGLYSNIIYGLSNNCGQLLIIFYGLRFTLSSRIYSSAISLAIVLVGYPIIAIFISNQTAGLAIGLVLTFVLGFFNAIIQSAGFGLAGICSAKSMEYFSVGQALSGLLPWPLYMLMNLIFKAGGVSNTADASAWSPLVIACNLTTLCIAAGVTFLFVPYYRLSLSKKPMVKQALDNMEVMKHSELIVHRPKTQILKDTLPLALSVWFVLYVTFVVFPSHIFAWSSSNNIEGALYTSLMLYIFQAFDVVGRYLVSFWKLSPKQTKIGCILRALFIPLFFLSTLDIAFFGNDVTRMIMMALFATSNGFLLTWCMIYGPGQVHKDEADVASYTMSFFLVNGIFFGSLTALGIQKAMA
jgi:hypothetical protein